MDRKEAIDILNDERIVIWTEPDEEEIARKQNEAIDMAIEALSAETHEIHMEMHSVCSDLISRADTIDAVANVIWHYPNEQYKNLNDYDMAEALAKDAIMSLPPIDRPNGEWIIRENGNKECSLCGRERQDGWDYFCGYCGARMKGGVE